MAGTTHPTLNDIPESTRGQVIDLLNQRLADAIDLQLQTKQAHWNVKGPQFIALHKLFDELHDAALEYVDLLAERVIQVGGIAEGTGAIVAERSELPQYPINISSGGARLGVVQCTGEFRGAHPPGHRRDGRTGGRGLDRHLHGDLAG